MGAHGLQCAQGSNRLHAWVGRLDGSFMHSLNMLQLGRDDRTVMPCGGGGVSPDIFFIDRSIRPREHLRLLTIFL